MKFSSTPQLLCSHFPPWSACVCGRVRDRVGTAYIQSVGNNQFTVCMDIPGPLFYNSSRDAVVESPRVCDPGYLDTRPSNATCQ